MSEAWVGERAELSRRVEQRHTAAAYGNPGVNVLGTPALVGWVEDAALAVLAPHLAADQHSVGTYVELFHEAPTPLGSEVVLVAEIEAVDGREVRFRVSTEDSGERVGLARHHRFVVESERFFRRAARKPD